MKLKRMANWLVKVWQWVAEGKIVFIGLLVIFIAIALCFYPWCSETSIRLAGCALQLLGVIFAIRGLLKMRVHFGQPPLLQNFIDWWKRFPKWKKTIVISAGSAATSLGGLSARLEVWTPDKPDHSIEKRFAGLLNNVNRLKTIQDEHTDSIARIEANLDRYKKEAVDNNKKTEDRIKKELELLHTSDFLSSLIGLVWLAVGVFLSTMAPELFKLICCL